MKVQKVLFISSEISPYLTDSSNAELGLKLPQMVQESGRQIRTFMPRWGIINERRNQLHEVIRLSGMNIIIDDTDHTLVIKVASVPSARIQVYFIDNDDYFHHRGMLTDEMGAEYTDNYERTIFYARGVLETVKKLRWKPDIIHCHGWIAALAPLYIKTAYRDDPPFLDAKVVFSAYGEQPTIVPPASFRGSVAFRGLTDKVLRQSGVDFSSPTLLEDLMLQFSDGVIQAKPGVAESTIARANEKGLPTLICPDEEGFISAYTDFYETVAG
ncbi:MAG: glycogen/starch synthase [Alloprevotella sp.]|nr:glycogen/starch synthase [Alloprevotella sp.]